MIFAGDETSGLSNAIVGARLICANPERASGAVSHVDMRIERWQRFPGHSADRAQKVVGVGQSRLNGARGISSWELSSTSS